MVKSFKTPDKDFGFARFKGYIQLILKFKHLIPPSVEGGIKGGLEALKFQTE